MIRLIAMISVVLPALGLVKIADAGQEAFPYSGYVSAADVNVRSGPGKDDYPTAQLNRGERVEIYRRDPGGWLAIRPPQGSYSWTPQRHLRLTKDPQVAEVVADDAVAWVGSKVKRIQRHKWQVSLKKGELVEVLGIERLVSPSGGTSETWCKIAPPAGEFRWIHGEYVSQKAVEDQSDNEPPRAANSSISKNLSGKQMNSVRSIGFREVPLDAASEGPGNTGRQVQTAGYKSSSAEADDSNSPRLNPAATGSRVFDAQLSELDIELSLIASRDPRSWKLAWLRKKTQSLIEAGKTPLQRGRARLLMDQIEAFEQLQQRYDRLQRTIVVGLGGTAIPANDKNNAGIGPRIVVGAARNDPIKQVSFGGGAVDRETPVGTGVAQEPSSSTLSQTKPSRPAIDPRYDAQGWLRPTATARRAGPLYTIEDQSGKLLTYVSPSPGLNLHRYLHKQVGLYGQRGYIPRLKTPHITASRVVMMDRLKRSR